MVLHVAKGKQSNFKVHSIYHVLREGKKWMSIIYVETHEEQSNEKSKVLMYLFRNCDSKGVSYHNLCFGRDSKTSRERGKLNSGKRGTALGWAVTGSCWSRGRCR